MTWGTLRADLLLKPAAGARAVWIMAGVGVLTGILSSLPSPLPDLRLENPGILINAAGIPLHAGIAFGAGMAIMLWLWANRDLDQMPARHGADPDGLARRGEYGERRDVGRRKL